MCETCDVTLTSMLTSFILYTFSRSLLLVRCSESWINNTVLSAKTMERIRRAVDRFWRWWYGDYSDTAQAESSADRPHDSVRKFTTCIAVRVIGHVRYIRISLLFLFPVKTVSLVQASIGPVSK